MPALYKYLSLFSLGIVLGLGLMFAALHRGSDQPMPTGDADVPRHEVKQTAPVRALDKKVLAQRKAVSGATEKAPEKEVLATGEVRTSDGTKTVAAVLDTKTGDTTLTENRAFMEWMSRHELGLGYGLVDGDMARAAQYRWTFGRTWRLYGTAQVEAFQIERSAPLEAGRGPRPLTGWNVMAFGTLRF